MVMQPSFAEVGWPAALPLLVAVIFSCFMLVTRQLSHHVDPLPLQALTGLGKTAVLYIYPFESHGPRAMETYLDLWARWLLWFDKYVKNPAGDEKK
jgi:hypothetical protein